MEVFWNLAVQITESRGLFLTELQSIIDLNDQCHAIVVVDA